MIVKKPLKTILCQNPFFESRIFQDFEDYRGRLRSRCKGHSRGLLSRDVLHHIGAEPRQRRMS